jgi:hypothetical protein
MWSYDSANGNLSHDGEFVGTGYSGFEAAANDQSQESVPNVGPIPRGDYTIGDFFDDPGGKGPIVADLTPDAGTDTFGRSGFMIHGDNVEMNHSASHGCIILAHAIRQQISDSGDSDLEVV